MNYLVKVVTSGGKVSKAYREFENEMTLHNYVKEKLSKNKNASIYLIKCPDWKQVEIEVVFKYKGDNQC
jgi:hypothetical protein